MFRDMDFGSVSFYGVFGVPDIAIYKKHYIRILFYGVVNYNVIGNKVVRALYCSVIYFFGLQFFDFSNFIPEDVGSC